MYMELGKGITLNLNKLLASTVYERWRADNNKVNRGMLCQQYAKVLWTASLQRSLNLWENFLNHIIMSSQRRKGYTYKSNGWGILCTSTTFILYPTWIVRWTFFFYETWRRHFYTIQYVHMYNAHLPTYVSTNNKNNKVS